MIHPAGLSLHEGSIRWARSWGMLPTERHVRAAHQAKVGWLVARTFPTMVPKRLQVVADWTMLFFVLDDHIEQLGTADEVAACLQRLLGVLRADLAGCREDPLEAGMMDLRQRLLTMAPPRHVAPFFEGMAALFAGNVAEARHRERAQVPDLASYLQLREVTIGLQVMAALAEILEPRHLPERVREHPALRRLATRTHRIVGWANDLFTYEKERTQGQNHNLVLVLAHERRLPIEEAIAAAVALHDDEVRSFLQEAEQLPSFGAADVEVQRHVEMLKCWIRGHLDWAYETSRYRSLDEPASAPASRPAGTPVAA